VFRRVDQTIVQISGGVAAGLNYVESFMK
jgi:hypothetical protein